MKTNGTYIDFDTALENFFQKYLVSELGASQNTIRSYRDAFVLLIDFFEGVKKVHPDRLSFEHITKDNVIEYLNWLETTKGSGTSTRNNRCAAIRIDGQVYDIYRSHSYGPVAESSVNQDKERDERNC